MIVYSWRSEHGNVGDDLNPWLWPRVFGDGIDASPDSIFIGIGSVLDRRHEPSRHKIVFGAGARQADTVPDVTTSDWQIEFVRGPLTAAALPDGYRRWISDPAIILPRYLAAPRTTRVGRPEAIGLATYMTTDVGYARRITDLCGYRLIPSTLAPEAFVDALLQCDAVFAESMHGAILADAYGIPWCPVQISNRYHEGDTHAFKWRDWLSSLELTPSFVALPVPWRSEATGVIGAARTALKVRYAALKLSRAARRDAWVLSDRELLASKQDEILACGRDLMARLAGAGEEPQA